MGDNGGSSVIRFAKRYVIAAAGALYAFSLVVLFSDLMVELYPRRGFFRGRLF